MTNLLESWEAKTFTFLDQQGWDPKGKRILLAISGGADSTALFHFWVQVAAAKFNCKIAVVHVHHGLRSASDLDEAFVEDLCRHHNLPLFFRKLNPKEKPNRVSTEMWARNHRYQFFSEAAKKCGAEWIATAHHKDDLVETVFQRLARGTGVKGLAGIPFTREPGIVRPFLNRSHSEILDYLKLRQASWREDESNADLSINRNWFRHKYLPEFRKREKNLDDRIFSMAMQLQSMGQGLSKLEHELTFIQYDENGSSFLPRFEVEAKVNSMDRLSLALMLDELIKSAFGIEKSLMVTKELLEEFIRQWKQNPDSLQMEVVKNRVIKAQKGNCYGQTIVSKSILGLKKPSPLEIQKVILKSTVFEFTWQWENQTYKLLGSRYEKSSTLRFPDAKERRALFDASHFSSTLSIRTRRAGDCFSPFGIQSHTRKLKVFFNEKKVPVNMRDSLPILLSQDSLFWVPGLGISEFFKVKESTTSILELVLTCENL